MARLPAPMVFLPAQTALSLAQSEQALHWQKPLSLPRSIPALPPTQAHS
jgi:hypothetical protein